MGGLLLRGSGRNFPRGFSWLFVARGAARFSDGLFSMGCLIIASRISGSAVLLVGLASVLPVVVTAPLLGRFAGQLGSRRVPVMVGLDLGRVGLVALPLIGVNSSFITEWGLGLLLIVSGLLGAFMEVAVNVLVPDLFEDETPVRGNAALAGQMAALQVVTPALAGVILSLSTDFFWWCCLLGYAISALCLLPLRDVQPSPSLSAEPPGGRPERLGRGLRIPVKDQYVRTILWQAAPTSLIMYTLILVLAGLSQGQNWPPVALGALYGTIALGRVAGSAVAGVADGHGRIGLASIMRLDLAVRALAFGLMFVFASLPVMSACVFVSGVTQGWVQSVRVTELQIRARGVNMGEVFGWFGAANIGVLPFAPGIVWILTQVGGMQYFFLVACVGFIALIPSWSTSRAA